MGGMNQQDRVIDYQGSGTAEDVLRWALGKFHPRIALSTSFKEAVLLHMITRIRPDVRVFAIDTGRLNEETYACAEAVRERFGIEIEWYFPNHDQIERFQRDTGPLACRTSREARLECCRIRKVEPLKRALAGLDAWITGLRRDQGVTRTEIAKIARDDLHGGIIKINPLADWNSDQIWRYIRRHNLPYNSLYDYGYQSIGCATCTRAIEPGQHPRSGRWWWEDAEHKECGLHMEPKPTQYNI
jgi:phosphoadenosine phosphosulfate reductase